LRISIDSNRAAIVVGTCRVDLFLWRSCHASLIASLLPSRPAPATHCSIRTRTRAVTTKQASTSPHIPSHALLTPRRSRRSRDRNRTDRKSKTHDADPYPHARRHRVSPPVGPSPLTVDARSRSSFDDSALAVIPGGQERARGAEWSRLYNTAYVSKLGEMTPARRRSIDVVMLYYGTMVRGGVGVRRVSVAELGTWRGVSCIALRVGD
jgi:hypothetical protein